MGGRSTRERLIRGEIVVKAPECLSTCLPRQEDYDP